MEFCNGIYKVVYDEGPEAQSPEHALVVVRDGSLLGSEPNGGIFSGTVTCDDTGTSAISATLTVPPFGELITGFAAGPAWAKVAVTTALDACKAAQQAVVEVNGIPLPVTVCYIGPLPD